LTSSAFAFYSGPGAGWDVPDLVGPIKYIDPHTDPKNHWFDPSAFAHPVAGTEGNVGRDILRGPGRNNFDFSLIKETKVTESTKVELRFEFYNIFNHTQFDPSGITTDINAGSSFGRERKAYDPRLIELTGKFYFQRSLSRSRSDLTPACGTIQGRPGCPRDALLSFARPYSLRNTYEVLIPRYPFEHFLREW
jgi:hypothetical protein